MTRHEAVQKMRRLFGKDAKHVRYRVAKTVTSPEKRAAARAELQAVRGDKRRRGPDGDVEPYDLQTARERALFLAQVEYRFRIFRNDGWMNIEVGKGDTWEEAFASIKPVFLPRGEAAGRAS